MDEETLEEGEDMHLLAFFHVTTMMLMIWTISKLYYIHTIQDEELYWYLPCFKE